MELNQPIPPAGESLSAPAEGALASQAGSTGGPQPIAQLVDHADFPQCAIGKQVDIGGITGEVVGVVKHSLKLRSRDGVNRSYNIHVLRKLYGAPPPFEPMAPAVAAEPPPPAKPEVKRDIVTNPNFDAPLKPIEELVNRPDFPKCAFGDHIDFRGYSGVVVEIVNRSLKVRSREGATRSYNADGLKKLYAVKR